MLRVAVAVLLLTACSGGGAPPTTQTATSAAAIGTPSPCPSGYPVSDKHGEVVWEGNATIVSIVSLSDASFTARLVGDNAFTPSPLLLHWKTLDGSDKRTLADLALSPGDAVHLQLFGRSDDCSYQVGRITKNP